MTEVWPPHGEDPEWLAPYVAWDNRYATLRLERAGITSPTPAQPSHLSWHPVANSGLWLSKPPSPAVRAEGWGFR